MIQKGLDFRCQQSVAVWALGAVDALGILPCRLHGDCGASVVTARDGHRTPSPVSRADMSSVRSRHRTREATSSFSQTQGGGSPRMHRPYSALRCAGTSTERGAHELNKE